MVEHSTYNAKGKNN